MNIVLLGYMGCGKSLIGRILESKTRMVYYDLDHYIEQKEDRTIPEIFEGHGEIYFRKKEHMYLKELLGDVDNSIISLGGGTPCFSGNMDLVIGNSNCRSIYLKTSIHELVNRLFSERNKRPLIAHIKSKDELTEFIGKHLFERSYFYNQASSVVVTDLKKPDTIAVEIKNLLISK